MEAVDVLKFNLFVELNARINSDFQDLSGFLTEIIGSAARLCDAEAVSLFLVDRETGFLYFEAALGPWGVDAERRVLKTGESAASWVFEQRQTYMVASDEQTVPYLSVMSDNQDYVYKTMIAAPMLLKNACIGVIEVVNKKDGQAFTENDREWLELFAVQAAFAVSNARLLNQARGEIERLSAVLTDKDKCSPRPMIAKSHIIQEKLDMAARIAQTDSSVLILGESGVGKELFAERIHAQSPRAAAPFVSVNCAALPETLLESELFGYVKGAFTGADVSRKGRFELARGGTIFLDEVGELPLPLQAKLLRVLQQKIFERVGDSTPMKADVRILAATNRDIEAMVGNGTFREDLYYRLNVLPLYVPPLRQRLEDILILADFFLKKHSLDTKKAFDGFSEDALQAMLSYSWPGNVRELENSVERACVFGRDKLIGAGDLGIKTDFCVGNGRGFQTTNSLKAAIDSFKAGFIKKALEEHKWNQTAAAKTLDIQRTYLSKLIKDLKIVQS